jgi:TolA-binding protein
MSNHVKIALYIVLVLVAGISGYYALTNFGQMMDRAADRNTGIDQIEPERKLPSETTEAVAATNAAAETNTITPTNTAAATTNTNQVAQTVSAEQTEAPTALSGTAGAKPPAKASSGGGRIGLWTALFLISIIALGFLIASDVSQFMGSRALKTLYNDEGEGVKNPEYEHAEEVWAKGQHLEAIGLMREYLQKNPREQHVAMRIAEIYEKDLRNFLAAALEYEEVLKHKLPPDRWGWAAIHLCNLYFKLQQEDKAYTLLRRLVKEYPQTPAADKARKRLEQVDGASFEQLATEQNVRGSTPAAPAAAPAEPASNLPPGFRPKK